MWCANWAQGHSGLRSRAWTHSSTAAFAASRLLSPLSTRRFAPRSIARFAAARTAASQLLPISGHMAAATSAHAPRTCSPLAAAAELAPAESSAADSACDSCWLTHLSIERETSSSMLATSPEEKRDGSVGAKRQQDISDVYSCDHDRWRIVF
eukprot:4432240-Pleurochrysis_carterae.AAC.1